MNELSILNDYTIGLFQDNVLVNTISIVPSINIDANKENVYPLVNVDLTDSDIKDDAIIASYTITVINQREVKPIKTDSKLLNNTNYLDNVNETHSICAKFINHIRRLHNDNNIMVETLSTLRPLKNWGAGGMDGFQFDVDLSINNKGLA